MATAVDFAMSMFGNDSAMDKAIAKGMGPFLQVKADVEKAQSEADIMQTRATTLVTLLKASGNSAEFVALLDAIGFPIAKETATALATAAKLGN